ncbi:hypothetical protein M5D96_006143 [Drosophila gunungcola]|uniref:Phosphate transporter n=1 Tax=Drosophila gunungcola TaxID=103775 RepID=A0A9Q0BQI9_9MUSC|nr:hypothetical protein M5D96_006143 [Drosophila gunungcola]
MESFSPDLLWMVVLGFLIAFILAFGIGANDVANSFGTSVGSGVLTIRQACILATICEISGAVLIGYKVSDTMRKGILEVGLYEGSEDVLMLGCVSALASSAVWLLVATFLKLPISGTHSIVGSTIGFSLVARGAQGLKWTTLGTIAGFRSLPIFYGVTFFINVISVVLDGPKLLYMDNIPTWIALSASFGLSLLVALLTQLVVVPLQRRKIAKRLRAENPVKFNFEDSLAPFGLAAKNNNAPGEEYKIDPQLIKKAEDLLGKASLDNTDLTITSLNFIDEQQQQQQQQQQQNGRQLQECFKRMQSPKEEQKHKASANGTDSGAGATKATNNNLQVVESGGSLDLMISSTLSPNSSKVPLIESKEALNEQEEELKRTTAGGRRASATFGSFAHGGNDVSNAIGPLIALYMIYREGSVMQQAESPIYILIYGGVGISVGLWLWGRRVIETIGNDLTKITSSTGFTIEVGAAITVLLASKIGLPISTTHCKVGSVVFVGHVSAGGRKKGETKDRDQDQDHDLAGIDKDGQNNDAPTADGSVDWHLFRNIAYAWIVTVPVTALLSAGMMYVLCAIAVDEMGGA